MVTEPGPNDLSCKTHIYHSPICGGGGGCGPTAVEEVPVLPVPWCLCVCVPVCPFVPVSICLWVCAGGCPKTPLVSVRPFTSVLCENYNLTGERALFSRCTEWGLGLGLTDRSIPRRQFFTAPCGCGLQHRGPWGRSQTSRTLQAGCPLCSTERGSFYRSSSLVRKNG